MNPQLAQHLTEFFMPLRFMFRIQPDEMVTMDVTENPNKKRNQLKIEN